MSPHHELFERLRISTCLLIFYGYLSRGFFDSEAIKVIKSRIDDNISSLNLMKDFDKWDNNYQRILEQERRTHELINEAKGNIKYEQICKDIEITNFIVKDNNQIFRTGIILNDLRKFLNIETMFKNGYMLHDVFHGYPEKNMYRYQIDCLDYVHSASYFYNEGYDFCTDKKKVTFYNEMDISKIHSFEIRRIQPKEEVIFRNFREAYINIVLFIESFINSVGYDAYLAGVATTDEEKLNLRGIQNIKKNGKPNYSDLAQRIKTFAKIIGNNSIDIGTEPYQSYLNTSIELRNQYIHSTPEKGKMRLGWEDWKLKCDEMISTKSYDFLNSFWTRCYPNKTFPKVIFNEFYGNSFKGHQGRVMLLD